MSMLIKCIDSKGYEAMLTEGAIYVATEVGPSYYWLMNDKGNEVMFHKDRFTPVSDTVHYRGISKVSSVRV